MNQKTILLADRELNYLAPLEKMILKEYGEEAKLSLITDEGYLPAYMEQPRHIDLAVFEKSLWKEEFRKQSIGRLLFLTEEKTTEEGEVYKYSSLREVFSILTSNASFTEHSGAGSTKKLIAVYSPQGGSGKTTLAIGLARALCGLNRRVLYLSCESIQTFSGYLKTPAYADRGFLKELGEGKLTEKTLIANIHPGKPDLVLPLHYSLTGSGLTEEAYLPVLRLLRENGAYDHIVLDMGSQFSSEKAALLNLTDCVLLPFTQSISGAMAMEALIRNMDTQNTDRFRFVCNIYREDRINELAGRGLWQYMRERIPYDPEQEKKEIGAAPYQDLALGLL